MTLYTIPRMSCLCTVGWCLAHLITSYGDTNYLVKQKLCVEDRSKIPNIMWVSVRNAHKRSKDNKPIKGRRAHRRTYAQVAAQVNE